MMNIWQGDFPEYNTKDDGYEYTCPVYLVSIYSNSNLCHCKKQLILVKVDKFEQNSFGLKNIVGNVWEWVEDSWSIDHSSKRKPVSIS